MCVWIKQLAHHPITDPSYVIAGCSLIEKKTKKYRSRNNNNNNNNNNWLTTTSKIALTYHQKHDTHFTPAKNDQNAERRKVWSQVER